MATVRVEEAYSERDETIDAKGNVTEVEIPYLVFNVADESAALAGKPGGLANPRLWRGRAQRRSRFVENKSPSCSPSQNLSRVNQ